MGNLRSARPSTIAAALLACAAFALTGCSSTGDAGATPAPARTATPTTAASTTDSDDPVMDDVDTSAAAVCGRLSMLTTISLNASTGHSRGELSDAQYEALLASVRFGYERLVSTDPTMTTAVDYTQRYLEDHPAPATGPAIDETTADWDLVGRTLVTACRDAGSSIVADAQYGG
ncbi:hypothetical protein EDF24_0034 [Curtobacterium sp. PhB130]|uniref:hypothetical protein n=1 Tax=unclassified Curtobacterium TaxID=257496 RepID=UPI000F4B41B7|nr:MULTISPECIES: hypothetical protein [unclassified Curtobacterium]ROS77288.1 hypothetical protein EDF24_0034 [Curtobacterium sp. PhB130]TCK66507.1 hypothetical protein EDF27_1266 [Curtobacterium sp. PhB136]